MQKLLKPALKKSRDIVADSAAHLISKAPKLEAIYLRLGLLLSQFYLTRILHRRIVETLVNRCVASGNPYRRLSFNGVEIIADVCQFTARDYYFHSIIYEPLTTDFLLSNLKAGDVFVDIGANSGYYSIMAAQLVGDTGKVFAFEPNPQVLVKLREHISVNGIGKRVISSGLAISDKSSHQVDFFISNIPANSGLSSLVLHEYSVTSGQLSDSHKIPVTTKTLDEWVAENEVGRIDVVKIDVEGAEDKVLRGMKSLLSLRPPRSIICETSWDSPADQLLTSYGYSGVALETNGYRWVNILYRHA